jgi:3-methyladenine DNA glycosylase/8-oxoguanine DNA glycosylase
MATEVPLPDDLDLRRSLTIAKLEPVPDTDDAHLTWIAAVTPEGAGQLSIRQTDRSVVGCGYGPGGDWLEGRLPDIIGTYDDPEHFDPGTGPMRRFAPSLRGIRFVRTSLVMDGLVQAIVGQRVATTAAQSSVRKLRVHFGEPAPGPGPSQRMLPGAETLGSLTASDLHVAGIERSRAVIIIECARRIGRLSEILQMSPADADRRLQAIRGVGPWTSAIVSGLVLGDPDAVPVGDYHLPNTVAWNLVGEDRADDQRMLELLEPWKGQRRRALLALKLGGSDAPRYGPRRAISPVSDL